MKSLQISSEKKIVGFFRQLIYKYQDSWVKAEKEIKTRSLENTILLLTLKTGKENLISVTYNWWKQVLLYSIYFSAAHRKIFICYCQIQSMCLCHNI